MELLNWKKKPSLQQADLDLVHKALDGKLPASVKEHFVFGDIYTKYEPNGVKIPKERTAIYKPDKIARRNWGDLYRACRRLVDCGEIIAFTLRQNGELCINWKLSKKNITTTTLRKVDNIEYLQPSEINRIDKKEDIRRTSRHKAHKLDTTPIFKPYDAAPLRVIVEDRILKDHAYLHSEEARVNRERQFKSESSCCDMWGPKFKLNPDYFSRDMLAKPFNQIFNEHCAKRGWCAWPSPIYKTFN